MSATKEMEVTIQEVARIALEDPEMRSRIGHELDLSDVWMETVFQFLNRLLNEEV
jgi:hypothetical protein